MVLLGNCGTGKSSIATRFVRDEFVDAHDTTVGAAFQTKMLTLPDTVEVREAAARSSPPAPCAARLLTARPPPPICNVQGIKVELWDTAGQERYRSLAPMYYRGAQAAIVVFDVTSRESYEGAKQWVRELQKKLEKGIIIALAANKVDLASRRKVDSDEAAMYASENGLLYCETSAKDRTNIDQLFVEVGRRVPKTSAMAARKDLDLGGGSGGGGGGRKDGPKPPTAGGGGCCG